MINPKLRFLLIVSLLFWAPALASAQETDTSAGFEASAGAQAGSSDGASSGGSTSGGGSATSSLDPGPDRVSRPHDGAPDPGTLGIGADGLLSGLAGIQGRLQVTDTIGLQLALRFDVAALNDTSVGFGTGFSGIFSVFEFESGHLALVGSVDFQFRNNDTGMGSQTFWDIGIGGGIFAELFPTEFFSIHGQAGARIAFGDNNGTNTFSLGIGGDIFAGFGFTFWFI